jgi:mannose/fructose-specific phosphotransferase system component IIA
VFEIVVSSHAGVARGIKEALEMFFGEVKNCHVVCLDEQGVDVFSNKVHELADHYKDKDTLVCTDLAGGTPYNQFAQVSFDWSANFKLVGGINLPFMIEAVNARLQGRSMQDAIKQAEAVAGLTWFDPDTLMNDEDDDDDE